MIAIFDEDGGGDVDFQEFVSGLSAFSSKGNKEQKLRFAFKVYDSTSSHIPSRWDRPS